MLKQVINLYSKICIWITPLLLKLLKNFQILLSNPRYIDKASVYRFIKPWLNEGLLLSTGFWCQLSNICKFSIDYDDEFFSGKKWHNRRKLITPAFHFNILEDFVKVFDRLGCTVVQKLKKFDANDDVEFYSIAMLYTLDVMCGEYHENDQLQKKKKSKII